MVREPLRVHISRNQAQTSAPYGVERGLLPFPFRPRTTGQRRRIDEGPLHPPTRGIEAHGVALAPIVAVAVQTLGSLVAGQGLGGCRRVIRPGEQVSRRARRCHDDGPRRAARRKRERGGER